MAPSLTINDLSVDMLQRVVSALTGAGIPYSTSQVYFTVEEAKALLEEVSSRQRGVLVKVAAWDGVLPAEQLRESSDASLRGISGPITKAIERLVKNGTIRPGLENPVSPVYDPELRSYQRVRAYRMDMPNVGVFAEAAKLLGGHPEDSVLASADESAVHQIFSLVKDALATGAAHVADRSNPSVRPTAVDPALVGWTSHGGQWLPQGPCIGWIDGTEVWLEPRATLRAVKALPDAEGLLPAVAQSERAVGMLLGKVGWTPATEGRTTIQRRVGGRPVRVWPLAVVRMWQ